MKKFLLIPVMLFAFAFVADNGKWTGYISDSHCGAMGNDASHAACAKKCIKEGYKPVLVVGDKVYALSNPEKASDYVGDKVTIEGTLVGDTAINIEKISK